MADRDNPNTHVENDKDADLPRKQPESPQHSGIDPLTEGDTMYPATDTKADSTRLGKKTEKQAVEDAENGVVNEDSERQAKTVSDQENLGNDAPAGNDVGSLTDRDEPAKVGSQRTEPVKADGKVQPQTKTPAKTNDSEVAAGSTEPADDDTNAATGAAPSKNAKSAK